MSGYNDTTNELDELGNSKNKFFLRFRFLDFAKCQRKATQPIHTLAFHMLTSVC